MSFARAYSYTLPREASVHDTNKFLDSVPPLLLSPSQRSRTAAAMAMTPSSRSRSTRQLPNLNASPLLLDTDRQPSQRALTIDAATPHPHYASPSHQTPAAAAAAAHRSYIDSLLATPRPGYTPLRAISPEYWAIFMSNFRTIYTLAWPVIITYLLQYSMGVVNLIFIGHISAEKLAAAALGNMFANITGYAVAFGLATAVDTLCSQAYGAGSMKLIGLIVQRACCIMTLTAIPILAVWYYTADLLVLLKQDPAISADAGDYVWRLAPSLVPYLLFELMKKYLIAQRINKPLIFILLATSLSHATLVYLFVHPLGMGFLGAPTATATAQTFMLLLGLAVIRWKGYHKETWPALSMNILRGWLPILRFGLPGMLMLCLEWWSFELCALAAGWLGAIQLDSFVVLLQVQSFIFMIPLGMSVAISTITGNRLGAGEPQLAKQGAAVAIFIGLVTQTTVAVVLILARTEVGRIFSQDLEVVELVAEVFPITGVMLLFDAMQVVCGGVLRGLGFQSIGAVANLVGFYLFGLPLAALLVWLNWQVKGLVLGLLFATSITASVFTVTISRVNWEKESHKAVERATAEKAAADQQQQQQADYDEAGDVKLSMRSDAGKAGKEFYMDDEKEAGNAPATEMTAAPSQHIQPVRNYQSVAIAEEEEEEHKESGRPLSHV